MELSATLASWEEDRLTVHDATAVGQGDAGDPGRRVRPAARQGPHRLSFVAAASAAKGFIWPHTSWGGGGEVVGRPVRLN